MHTFKGSDGASFQHNPDLTGIVQITGKDGRTANVSGHELLEFVADWVRRQRISRLEGYNSPEEILGVKVPPGLGFQELLGMA